MRARLALAALLFSLLTGELCRADSVGGAALGIRYPSSGQPTPCVQAAGTCVAIGTISGGAFTPSIPAGTVGSAMLSATPIWGITRALIATTALPPAVTAFVASGYSTAGDRGAGCIYVRGASNGPGAVKDALGGWWQFLTGKPLDVTCFGAKIDGETPDTGAFQAAVDAATGQSATGGLGRVTVPPGIMVVCQVVLKGNLAVSGSGKNVSNLRPCSPTTNVFVTLGTEAAPTTNLSITDFTITSYDKGVSQQTAGVTFFLNNCTDCSISRNKVVAAYSVVYAFGGQASFIDIDHNNFVSFKDRGIIVEGGLQKRIFANLIDGIWGSTDAPTYGPYGQFQANACIEFRNDAGSFIGFNDLQRCGVPLAMVPGDGQAVSWLVSTGGYADSSNGDGLLINPTGTGRVDNARFSQFWTSTNKGAGVRITCTTGGASGKTGQVTNVTIADHTAQHNFYSGAALGCGTGTDIRGGTFAGNNLNEDKAASGIDVAAGVSDWKVVGARFTLKALRPDGGRLVGVHQLYGIHVAAGASDYYRIRDPDGADGTTSGTLVKDEGTGTHKIVDPGF